ncbi:hypothetical protein [Pseudomonas sp. JAI120]|uniref:hypothetical protein n=1 Tax=Pseudomonas sp. JAI120 TaxID=2723063 RepID=UPI0030D7CC49
MKTQKILIALSCAVALSMLGGCAAKVKSGGSGELTIPESAKHNLVVSIKGEGPLEQNPDWTLLKRDWNNALQVEARQAGFNVTETPSVTKSDQDGVGITISVSKFRYIEPGSRYVAGALVGNAWVFSRADFSDLKSGAPIGSRTYDTSSSAWEGIASAMTQKQVQAIAKQLISDIKSAKAK